jgi:hypothetical protein
MTLILILKILHPQNNLKKLYLNLLTNIINFNNKNTLM